VVGMEKWTLKKPSKLLVANIRHIKVVKSLFIYGEQTLNDKVEANCYLSDDFSGDGDGGGLSVAPVFTLSLSRWKIAESRKEDAEAATVECCATKSN